MTPKLILDPDQVPDFLKYTAFLEKKLDSAFLLVYYFLLYF